MASGHSVTRWIGGVKAGDEDAAQKLWEGYFQRLVRLARKRLGGTPRRVADEEDAVVSAFDSFCRGARESRFPDLRDRDDLWRLLVVITARKVVNQRKYHGRLKRGGGRVCGESAFGEGELIDGPGIAQVVGDDPTPEFALMVAEEYQGLLDGLDDPTLRSIAVAKMEGYTNDEIAQQVGRTRRTVARKLQLIRKKIEWAATNDKSTSG